MTDVPVKAILRLVQYLEADERKHFEAKWESGEDISNHIFNYVRAVSDWLDGQPGIPTAAERERQRLAPIEKAFARAGVAMDGDFADFWRASNAKEVN
jgi:hypothetical protein